MGQSRDSSRFPLGAAEILPAAFALVAPFSISAATTAAAAGLLACLLSPRLLAARIRQWPAFMLAVFFYYLVQISSIVFSVHPLRSLLCLRGDWSIIYLPVFLCLLSSDRSRRIARAAFLSGILLASLLGLFQAATGIDPLGRTTPPAAPGGIHVATGAFRHHLTYGGVVLVGFLASTGLLLDRLLTAGTPRTRPSVPGSAAQPAGAPIDARGRSLGLLLPLAASVASGAALVVSLARSAWAGGAAGLALLIGFAVAFAARSGRRRAAWGITALAGAAVAGILVLFASSPALRHRLSEAPAAGDLPRVRLWATALRVFANHPILGAGLGAFKKLLPAYKVPGWYLRASHPHNDILNTLVHSGAAGFLALAAMAWTLLRSTFRRGRGFLPWALLALLAGFAVAGLGQCYLTDEEAAGTLFIAAALLATSAAEGPHAGEEKAPGAGKEAPATAADGEKDTERA